jgi:hypothetical protein
LKVLEKAKLKMAMTTPPLQHVGEGEVKNADGAPYQNVDEGVVYDAEVIGEAAHRNFSESIVGGDAPCRNVGKVDVDDTEVIGESPCQNHGEGVVDSARVCGEAPRRKVSEGIVDVVVMLLTNMFAKVLVASRSVARALALTQPKSRVAGHRTFNSEVGSEDESRLWYSAFLDYFGVTMSAPYLF